MKDIVAARQAKRAAVRAALVAYALLLFAAACSPPSQPDAPGQPGAAAEIARTPPPPVLPAAWTAPNGAFSLGLPHGWEERPNPEAPPEILWEAAPAVVGAERQHCILSRRVIRSSVDNTQTALNQMVAGWPVGQLLSNAAAARRAPTIISTENEAVGSIRVASVSYAVEVDGQVWRSFSRQFLLAPEGALYELDCIIEGNESPTGDIESLLASLAFRSTP